MARNDEEYNWLDDPFDEKKQQPAPKGGCSPVLMVAGLVAVVLVCVFAVVSCMSVTEVLGAYAG